VPFYTPSRNEWGVQFCTALIAPKVTQWWPFPGLAVQLGGPSICKILSFIPSTTHKKHPFIHSSFLMGLFICTVKFQKIFMYSSYFFFVNSVICKHSPPPLLAVAWLYILSIVSFRLDEVAQSHNPSYLEGWDWKDMVQGQKVNETSPSQRISWYAGTFL
jgi:hypothetical protein